MIRRIGRSAKRGDNIEEFRRKHLSWFIFDSHPIRFAKKLSKEEQTVRKPEGLTPS